MKIKPNSKWKDDNPGETLAKLQRGTGYTKDRKKFNRKVKHKKKIDAKDW